MRRRFDRKLRNLPARALRAGLRQPLRLPAAQRDVLLRLRTLRTRTAALAALRLAARSA